MNFYKYAEMIDDKGITPDIIADIVKDHKVTKDELLDKFGRYKQAKENVPILTREFEGAAAKKVNNKIANDYLGEIVDTKVGYMFGIPMVVNYDKKAQSHQSGADAIERFKKVNNFDDINAEWGKFSAMCGYDAGLCYIDGEGQERVMRINPWEAVIISRTAITEPEYGLVYYTTWDDKARAIFYDGVNKTVFEGDDFTAEKLAQVDNPEPHLFSYCPLFGIPNNAELQGDADKVISLIDGLDRAFSNMADEVEQFRLAYLLFIGYEPSDETVEAMVKTGALHIPESGNNEDIRWLIKDLDPTYVEAFLDRAEANITRFAKHVNFTDAAFGSDITGPAMRYKLFALETKSKYFERKHEAAMLYMFKVIGSAWNTKSIPFDYTMLDMRYTRNIPVNLLDEATTATILSGIASKETALSTLSIVADVTEELAKIESEKVGMIDLDDPDLIDDPLKKANGGE